MDKLQKSIVTITTIDNKTDSAFMFELQNNRGRDITAMEQVKAFLMYQIYVNEKTITVNNRIEKISDLFGEIYLFLNDIKNINEDDLLWYHCNAYYGYSTIDDNYDTIVDFLKESINNISEKENKLEVILRFVEELRQTFSNIHEMEKNKNIGYFKRLNLLGIPGNLYPIIINGYRFIKQDDRINYLDKLFHLCELLAFRLAIIPTNGNVKVNKRLDNILDFEGDLFALYSGIKSNFANDENEWRWTDDSMHEVLIGSIYGKVTNNVVHYIFKIYENIVFGNDFPKLKKIWIEHISPQTPKNVFGSGYELTKKYKYSIKFQSQYLHCLGNLMLSTEKQQHELDNKVFFEKLKIYNKNELGLMHQTELEKFLERKISEITQDIEKENNREIKDRQTIAELKDIKNNLEKLAQPLAPIAKNIDNLVDDLMRGLDEFLQIPIFKRTRGYDYAVKAVAQDDGTSY
ncbi:MAG: HNH endonuclease family protein, partial [Leptospirales bacterium]|nr:HNH endonuclease family protein [Leptospirales bacterium]